MSYGWIIKYQICLWSVKYQMIAKQAAGGDSGSSCVCTVNGFKGDCAPIQIEF